MKAIFTTQKEEQDTFVETPTDKSELMQVFEHHVTDTEWAYKDLLKAIFESEN